MATTKSSSSRLETSLALFDRILESLPEESIEDFAVGVERRLAQKLGEDCCCSSSSSCGEEEEEESERDAVVSEAIRELKTLVPLSAQSPEEEALGRAAPAEDPAGRFAGCTRANSAHVDAFLFTDADVDALCDAGRASRHYCAACGSRTDVRPLNMLSHSASRGQLEFVFGPAVLCRGGRKRRSSNLAGKTVVDVGSRLGAALYVAWARTEARDIVGIELSAYFCDVQRKVLSRLPQLSPRVRVVEGDVQTQGPLLAAADVVVLNNVFEFFTDSSAQELELWRFVRHAVSKRGCRVVTIPSLAETAAKFGPAAAESLGFASWVNEVPLAYPDDSEGAAGDDYRDIHLYIVR